VDDEDGSYTAVITGSTAAGASTITATDVTADPDLTGSATLLQTSSSTGPPLPSVPVPPAPAPPRTPRVTLLKKPARKGTVRRPHFDFTSDVPGATFHCKLDRGAFKPCRPPITLAKLSFGRHTFSVRAADGAVLGPTATWSFRVVRSGHRHRRHR
jgi:hypothetical protein